MVKQVAYARDAIKVFEDKHPISKLNDKEAELRKSPSDNFALWRGSEIKECGDTEANDLMEPLVKEGLAQKVNMKVKISEKEKNFKDKMMWTRDQVSNKGKLGPCLLLPSLLSPSLPPSLAPQVHLLRRLQKEVTGRVRSLRFFVNVRDLQREGADRVLANGNGNSPRRGGKASGSGDDLALLSCCGHMGPLSLVKRSAADQLCHEHPKCTAPARPSCVIPVAELGVEAGTGGSVGVKLGAVIGLVKRIPKDERVIIFVQFKDLLEKVAEALKAEHIAAALLAGTPNQRSTIIDAFQQPELKSNEPRVLLLNLRDESAAGANLTQASHAIFVHPLLVSSQTEYTSCDTQAVGRIRRYGQARTVQLYRFLVSNSIDEEVFLSRRDDARSLLSQASTAETVGPMA